MNGLSDEYVLRAAVDAASRLASDFSANLTPEQAAEAVVRAYLQARELLIAADQPGSPDCGVGS
jgi:hypothetical protein